MVNDKIISCKFTRKELCKLRLACSALAFDDNGEVDPRRKSYFELHEKINAILMGWDETHDENGMRKETTK